MKDSGIILVINGYYRTGTTFLAKLFVKSNPDIVYIHEPCSPIISNELRAHVVGTPHPLHGWDVYEGYFKLGDYFVRKFIESYKPFSFIKEPEKVVEILGVIDDEAKRQGKKVLVKLNQGHLVLENIAKEFKCKIIHVINIPLKVMYEHIYPEHRDKLIDVVKYWLGIDREGAKYVGFWFESLADEVLDSFGLYQYRNTCPAMKFLISYLLLNKIATAQAACSPEIVVADFTELMIQLRCRVSETINFLIDFTGLNLSEKILKEIDTDLAYGYPLLIKTLFLPMLRRAQAIVGFYYG